MNKKLYVYFLMALLGFIGSTMKVPAVVFYPVALALCVYVGIRLDLMRSGQ